MILYFHCYLSYLNMSYMSCIELPCLCDSIISLWGLISAALTLSKFAISQLAMLASALLLLRHQYGILSVGEAFQVFQSLE